MSAVAGNPDVRGQRTGHVRIVGGYEVAFGILDVVAQAPEGYEENVTDFDGALAQVAAESITDYYKHMDAVDYPRALEAVWTLISPHQ